MRGRGPADSAERLPPINPFEEELDVLVAVVDHEIAALRLSRKLTFATGAGVVHGSTYVLRNWGLAEVAAEA